MNNEDFVVVRQNDTVERLPPNYLLAKRVRELEDRVQDLHTDKKWLHERARELDGKMRELEVKLAASEYDIERKRGILVLYELSELADRLERLVIMDEVGSNNPLAREAAAALRELEAELDRLLEGLKECRRLASSAKEGFAEDAIKFLASIEQVTDAALQERE